MNWLRPLAAGGRVPVFPIVGAGRASAVDDLCLSPWLQRVASPRHASILLVTGHFPEADRIAIERVHDQVPHPRATVAWDAGDVGRLPGATVLGADVDAAVAIRDLYRRLMTETISSEAALLPDEPPNPWRGVGEHGQGGKGMMGGTPYGRPMAMTGDDLRDGLSLDRCTVHLGPFFAALPAGMQMEVVLQGDVVQTASVLQPPYASGPEPSPSSRAPRSGRSSDRTRAAACLRSIAGLLTLLELLPQAERCRRLAMGTERGDDVRLLGSPHLPGRVQALRAIPRGLGRIDPSSGSSLGGVAPTARERLSDWFDEAGAALRVIARGETTPDDERSTASDTRSSLPGRLGELLVGLEWSEALIVVASFDVEALRRMSACSKEVPAEVTGSVPAHGHEQHSAGHSR